MLSEVTGKKAGIQKGSQGEWVSEHLSHNYAQEMKSESSVIYKIVVESIQGNKEK